MNTIAHIATILIVVLAGLGTITISVVILTGTIRSSLYDRSERIFFVGISVLLLLVSILSTIAAFASIDKIFNK